MSADVEEEMRRALIAVVDFLKHVDKVVNVRSGMFKLRFRVIIGFPQSDFQFVDSGTVCGRSGLRPGLGQCHTRKVSFERMCYTWTRWNVCRESYLKAARRHLE